MISLLLKTLQKKRRIAKIGQLTMKYYQVYYFCEATRRNNYS